MPNGDVIESSLREIASRLNKCGPDPSATVKYDLLADALIWPDELPVPRFRGEFSKLSMVRPLQRYRTTVILGAPDTTLEKYWGLGRELFPRWCGFQADRIVASQEHIELYWNNHPRGR